MSTTAPATSMGPLPYPNALQSRHTTTEQRQIAAAAVRAYQSTLEQEKVLLQENDALLSEEEAGRLQRRVDNQAAADATAAQFRDRACKVVASVPDEQYRSEGGAIDIFHAACDGDVAALDACLRSASNIDALGQPDPARYNGFQFKQRWLFRAPPLVFAAAFGREEAVRFLLEHGANPHVASTTGLRAQDYAAQRGYSAIVLMLTSGAPQ
ncbi:conserved hypothetical protein [Leishmania infantum JPCM5]|uniref:Ankyrin_repeats_(3_copies)/Ankyrin_repeat/Ankyrin _repeats_(Many_copies)_-__putative n=3 Tax=Leishmania donovani species complex TaxID=38574 RepID=A0A6L0WJ35_LEIIN|nr:conserved hypothetical protein [Leishmania infantum JPCM5]AYU76480.1 Ankyrin repeats (3 copies)/Ankyrin repeat/Ankyrin repeats (many copies), putative [Leishmania donovani]CAC9453631.1 Ankyrin_repeats_(3_copies)/Ankyrin_repeat/Ankyrin_repeats_(many_copies)_-__putative [Leishmania infantum]CAM65856.1 conserved hypothetical protein [Leishmania infantum JPCM5]SUZ39489.1 Ankyrin_repeats_(3_copies)/Ankyrin_repeat/Ankyrin_repeats_(many_copies)_-__putative [Leishmania infantum]|eukprot:XP_001463491.1 conserved hypothetical protein [Leishmania infantum JPCM5]